jgi:hypothetical protein
MEDGEWAASGFGFRRPFWVREGREVRKDAVLNSKRAGVFNNNLDGRSRIYQILLQEVGACGWEGKESAVSGDFCFSTQKPDKPDDVAQAGERDDGR